MGNFECVVFSASMDLPLNSEGDASFHRTTYNYSCADLEGILYNFTDVPCKDILKLSHSAAASKF